MKYADESDDCPEPEQSADTPAPISAAPRTPPAPSPLVKVAIENLHHARRGYSRVDSDEIKRAVDLACALMTQRGVTRAVVEYHGYGDDGTVEAPAFEPEGVAAGEDLEELVGEIVYTALPGGWEINEDSQGEVVLDPAAAPRMSFEHGVNYNETRDESFSFD